MREIIGIDDKGRFVNARLRYLKDNGEPDLLSYDDDIRQNYLEHPEQVVNDTDIRSWNASFERLGYPQYFRRFNYLAHSFEERFGVALCRPRRYTLIMLHKSFLSVVALSSFIGDARLFTCSGTIIESTLDCSTILTSASLVANSKSNGTRTFAANAKILVHFEEGPAYEASLVGHCLHYNVAFLRVQKHHQHVLPLIDNDLKAVPEPVFALGRHYVSRDVYAAFGETMLKRNNFDCKELMFSSCKITKCGVGGPLVNSRGDIVGLNFYDNDDAPYLPSSLVFRCMEHIKNYRYVHHLYFGWRVRPLGAINLALKSKIQVHGDLNDGLLVEKVANSSPAERLGIKAGDVIIELFGEPFAAIPVPKYAAALLDKATLLSGKASVEVQVKILRRSDHSILNDDRLIDAIELTDNHYNKWPLPEPEWKL